jgi:hypothetical protein
MDIGDALPINSDSKSIVVGRKKGSIGVISILNEVEEMLIGAYYRIQQSKVSSESIVYRMDSVHE